MSDVTPPQKRLFSLRAKMLAYFGLTFAVGLLAIGMAGLYGIPFTGYRGEYQLRREEALRGLNLLADTRKVELLRQIAERQGDAAAFCESPVMRRLVGRVCAVVRTESGAGRDLSGLRSALRRSGEYRLLAEHLTTIKHVYMVQYERIRLADAATGMVVASTDDNELGMDLSRDPNFITAKGGAQNELIDVRKDPRSGNAYLSLYHSTRAAGSRGGGEDEVTAVLILYLKPDLFIRFLETDARDMGKTGDIFLVDQDARLLTALKRPLPDGTIPRPLEFRVNSRPAVLAAEGNEGVMATTDYGGVPVLAAFRHLRLNSEVGWGMVVKKEQAEVFAATRQVMLYLTLIAAFLGLLVAGLSYAIATRLARPIMLLSRTAKRVEEGDFTARSLTEGGDEVGLLSRSFNSMVRRIQNWHAELEAEVRERTAELVTLNLKLSSEIEERVRAEEALRASELRFRELLETVHLVAVILDREGNITFCNDFLCNLTGWSRDEVLGRNWFDTFLPEEARSGVKSMFAESLAAADLPVHYENPIITRSGAWRAIVWDNTLLRDGDGVVVGTASLGIDVTEHRSIEEQLRHAQKMEAIGQLAGGVAHDFNNLLTVIIGNCELIKLKSGEDNPMRRYVEQILYVSGRAARLTQSLLAFSRKQLLSIQAVDANDCVKGVESLLARIIGEDIEFRLGLAQSPLPVMADRGQLEQVLVNLATNARDAMPDGGELLIETRRVDLDVAAARSHGLDRAGSYAVIQVSDSGSGMDEVTRQRMFDPFFTTKEVGKGTGLGLAMVFGTIRQHDGYIDVYSGVGEGTAFKIYLPLIPGDAAGDDLAPPHQAAAGGSETLLVVEDNEEVRRTTASLLASFGYRVIEAADGGEAVARFTEHRDAVNLVIMDVVMPRMNGKEVYDALQKMRSDVRVLFTSGYAADIVGKKVMLDGGLHLLQKPASSAELLSKVREVLDARC
jgi:two-component system cell cycle sensor histidine kinase/response regulator CckA